MTALTTRPEVLGGHRRHYRRVMSTETLSLVGDQLLAVALPLFLLDLTGSASLAAAAGLARVLPLAVLGAVGGAVVDRVSRIRLLAAASLARAATALTLLLVSAHVLGGSWSLVTVALLACLAQVTGPAVGASLPAVVSAEDLPRVNAQRAARTVVVSLAAPTAGAVLYQRYGFGAVVAVNAGLYALSALSWWRLPKDEPLPASSNRLLRDTRTGFQRVVADPVLLKVLVGASVVMMGLSIELAVLVPYIRQELGGTAAAVGVLTSLQAVGGLLAATVTSRAMRRYGVPAVMSIGLCGLPLATAGLLLSHRIGQAVPGVVAAGFFLTLLTSALQVHMQSNVETEYLGRALGVIGSVIGLASVVGSALALALLVTTELRHCLVVALCLELTGTAGYTLWRRLSPDGTGPVRIS